MRDEASTSGATPTTRPRTGRRRGPTRTSTALPAVTAVACSSGTAKRTCGSPSPSRRRIGRPGPASAPGARCRSTTVPANGAVTAASARAVSSFCTRARSCSSSRRAVSTSSALMAPVGRGPAGAGVRTGGGLPPAPRGRWPARAGWWSRPAGPAALRGPRDRRACTSSSCTRPSTLASTSTHSPATTTPDEAGVGGGGGRGARRWARRGQQGRRWPLVARRSQPPATRHASAAASRRCFMRAPRDRRWRSASGITWGGCPTCCAAAAAFGRQRRPLAPPADAASSCSRVTFHQLLGVLVLVHGTSFRGYAQTKHHYDAHAPCTTWTHEVE